MSEHITETPDGLRFVRGKGGTKIHLLPKNTMRSLCGYEPRGHASRHMTDRSGYWLVRIDQVHRPAWCEKCQQNRPEQANSHGGEVSDA